MRAMMMLVLLAGCATPYQRMGWSGGYEDRVMAPGVYLVTVNVNGYTSASTAFEYLQRRSYELCPTGFTVQSSMSDAQLGAVSHYDSFTHTTETTVVRKPEMSALIRCNSHAAPTATAPPITLE